jgi:iron complex outermembrane recepter protein
MSHHRSDERSISHRMTANGTPSMFPAAILFALAVSVALPARADTASEPKLHEIIITAQKRAQNIQNVGISILSQSGATLQNLGVHELHDLSQAFSGVQLYSFSGGDYGAGLTIRGIGTSDFSPQQESPDSFYMDDVYISSIFGQTGITFDVDRIEVDEGVQGTLFGRNSIGGLVNVITRGPSKTFDAYAQLTTGSFNEAKFEGAVGGPITSRIQGRIAVATQNNQGYDKNLLPGYPNLNSINFRGVRGQLQFEPTDDLTGLLGLYYIHDNNREGFYAHINTYYDPDDEGRPAPLPPDINAWGTGAGLDLQGYRFPGPPGPEGEINHIGFLRRDFVMPTLRFNWHLPGGEAVTSISAFEGLHINYDESCSGAPQFTCHDPYRQDLHQWSEELRLSNTTPRMSWVTGLYWLYIGQKDQGSYNEPYYSGTPFAFSATNYIYQRVTTDAVFGQLEYRLTQHWRPTVGVRVERDVKYFSSQRYWFEVGNGVTDTVYSPPLLVADFSKATVGGLTLDTENNWTGKIGMDYVWNPDLLLYASIARGVRQGGFNADITGELANSSIPFKPSHVLDYELGEKWQGLDDRVRLNSDAFYYDYADYQAYQLLTGVATFTSDARARFYGVEFSVDALPVSRLDLHLGALGLDSRVFNVHTAEIGIVDQLPAQTPKWNATASVAYSWSVGKGVLSAAWSSSYVGGRFFSVDNTPDVYVHSFINHNVHLTYSLARWSLIGGVDNLTNKAEQTAAYDETALGYAIQAYLPPRWWTLSVRYEVGE